MRYGPLKPIGLWDPRWGDVNDRDVRRARRAYAVVQLRQEDADGRLWNLVGFQTNLKWGEQKRVLRLIPGLENAEFVRFGVMHRNTFLNSPKLLDRQLRLKAMPRLRFAGQVTGVEGYVESAAMGLLTGRLAAAGIETVVIPWEPCLTHFMDGERVDALFDSIPSSPLRDFSHALAVHARQNGIKRGNPDRFLYVDPLAAAVVIDPSMVTKSITASSSVALAPGITRGMTLVDPSGRLGTPKITFVEEVDIGKIDTLYAVSAAYSPNKAN